MEIISANGKSSMRHRKELSVIMAIPSIRPFGLSINMLFGFFTYLEKVIPEYVQTIDI